MKKNTEKDTDNIFWDKITNAINFIDLIVDKFKIQSFILNNAEDIPWYTYFRTQIAKKVKKFSKSSLITIDGKKYKDIFEDEEKFDEFFLKQKYCSHDMWLNYDPSEESLAKYMAEHDAGISLHQKYIWVDIYSQESFDNWFNFVSEYVRYREEHLKYKDIKDTAYFLISCHGHFDYKSNINLESCSFRDSIDFYDCFIFFNLILSNFKILSDYYLPDYDLKENIEEAEKDIRTYIAEFVSNIIKDNINGKNIELFAGYLSEKSYKDFLNNPFNYINKTNIIDNSLFKSQLKIIFPILQEFRQIIIEKYVKLIDEFKFALNEKRKKDQGGQDINNEQIKKKRVLYLIENIKDDTELRDFPTLLSECKKKIDKIRDSEYDEIIKLNEKKEKRNKFMKQMHGIFKKENNSSKKNNTQHIAIDYVDVVVFFRDCYAVTRNDLAHKGNKFLSFEQVKNIIYSIRVIPVEVIMYYVEKYSICKKLGLL